jgi:nitrite reductase/ring-hydroxylating ferredoxin subunit
MSRLVRLPSTVKIEPGHRRLIDVEGHGIALFNIAGTLYAIDDNCPHHGFSLCYGRLEGRLIECSAHKMRFDVGTGSMPFGGLTARTFPVACVDGTIEITLPDETLGENGC